MKYNLLFILCLCFLPAFGQNYKVGDLVINDDGSKGIVFWLHEDRSGGWMVALDDILSFDWGSEEVDIPTLPNFQTLQSASSDFDGYENTRKLREYQNDPSCAAGLVDFDNGWYIPACGQINILSAMMPFIDQALVSNGGTGIDDFDFNRYWSSTEYDKVMVWTYEGVNSFNYKESPRGRYSIRAMHNFVNEVTTVDSTLSYLWSTGSTQPDIQVAPDVTTTYTVTVTTEAGCVVSASQTIYVKEAAEQVIYDSVCQYQPYNNYGFYVPEQSFTGTFYDTIVHSCDSSSILHLWIKPVFETLIYDTINVGESYTENDFSLPIQTDLGIIRDTIHLNANNSCDSTVILILNVQCFSDTIIINDTVCSHQSYLKYGFNIPPQLNAGNVSDTLQLFGINGCDTISILNLRINPVYKTSIFDTINVGEAYAANGFNLPVQTVPGIIKDTLTLTSITTCDSILYLELNVQCLSHIATINDTICQYQSYINNGFNLPVQATAGQLRDTLHLLDIHGCDSTVILNLQVNQVYKIIIADTINVGQAYAANGFNLPVQTAPGIVKDTLTLTSNVNCDSIIILQLNIKGNNIQTLINDTICQQQPYHENGFNLSIQTVPGLLRDTLSFIGQGGVDSLVILNLQINPIHTTIIKDTIHVGQPYTKNGFNLSIQTTPGIVNDTLHLSAQTSCDSVVMLTLHIHQQCPVIETIIYDTICQYESYVSNNFNLPVQQQSGSLFIHDATLTTLQGCDSVVHLYLTVNKVFSKTVEMYIAKDSFVIIDNQLYDTPAIISHTYTSSTLCDSIVTYVIQYKDQDQDECDPLIPALFFSPNNDGVNDYWLIENMDCHKEYTIQIYDRYGKLLIEFQNEFNGWDGIYAQKNMPSTDYWYIIEIKGKKAQLGHFTLKR